MRISARNHHAIATHLFPRGKEGYTRTNLTSVCNQIVNAGRSCDAQCSLAFTNFITKKGEIYEKPRRKPIEDS